VRTFSLRERTVCSSCASAERERWNTIFKRLY